VRIKACMADTRAPSPSRGIPARGIRKKARQSALAVRGKSCVAGAKVGATHEHIYTHAHTHTCLHTLIHQHTYTDVCNGLRAQTHTTQTRSPLHVLEVLTELVGVLALQCVVNFLVQDA
jgi:hypothetical protein